jgi:hypothetical protein
MNVTGHGPGLVGTAPSTPPGAILSDENQPVISTAQYCFVFRTTICTFCDTFTLLQKDYGAHPPCPADMLNQSQALIFQW